MNLNQAIQAEVPVELTGDDFSPGVKQGGVLEHVTREVTVEALPTDIPDLLTLDVDVTAAIVRDAARRFRTHNAGRRFVEESVFAALAHEQRRHILLTLQFRGGDRQGQQLLGGQAQRAQGRAPRQAR